MSFFAKVLHREGLICCRRDQCGIRAYTRVSDKANVNNVVTVCAGVQQFYLTTAALFQFGQPQVSENVWTYQDIDRYQKGLTFSRCPEQDNLSN